MSHDPVAIADAMHRDSNQIARITARHRSTRPPTPVRLLTALWRTMRREWQTIAMWSAPMAAGIYLAGHLGGLWP